MTLRQSWQDPRLNYSRFVESAHVDHGVDSEDPYTLVGDVDLIWRPDTLIRESRDVKVGDLQQSLHHTFF